MAKTTVKITAAMLNEMIEHSRQSAPLEACGILGGREGRATVFYPTPNEERSPTRYSIPAEEILRITRDLDQRGEELFAIFHSHPATEAYPSATDVRLAYYPDSYYLILSLKRPNAPDLRAFTIRNGQIKEYPLEIV